MWYSIALFIIEGGVEILVEDVGEVKVESDCRNIPPSREVLPPTIDRGSQAPQEIKKIYRVSFPQETSISGG